jgi:hypothetical protein
MPNNFLLVLPKNTDSSNIIFLSSFPENERHKDFNIVIAVAKVLDLLIFRRRPHLIGTHSYNCSQCVLLRCLA